MVRNLASPLFVGVALLAACGGTSQAETPTATNGTLGGVGVMPAAQEQVDPQGPDTSAPQRTIDRGSSSVGERADGNRMLMIGDSIMASVSRRYTNEMCDALVPRGWIVELDAESGRFVDFADVVLDARLLSGWDVVVIGLGSNYGGDQRVYVQELEAIVRRLEPRQVVLITVTEFEDDRREVNDVIALLAGKYDHVSVLDWATRTIDADEVLSGDGLHLSDDGRSVYAEFVADGIGDAPDAPGSCLASNYKDDSAGPVGGTGYDGDDDDNGQGNSPDTTRRRQVTVPASPDTTVAGPLDTTPIDTVPIDTSDATPPNTDPPPPPSTDPPDTGT
jgi:lysophospholipase L1-like esterase